MYSKPKKGVKKTHLLKVANRINHDHFKNTAAPGCGDGELMQFTVANIRLKTTALLTVSRIAKQMYRSFYEGAKIRLLPDKLLESNNASTGEFLWETGK